jgi:hypothetical protein
MGWDGVTAICAVVSLACAAAATFVSLVIRATVAELKLDLQKRLDAVEGEVKALPCKVQDFTCQMKGGK